MGQVDIYITGTVAVFGYALGAMTKPLFALASSLDMVLTARLMDRIGKGIRGAPRDALVADIAPPQLRGAAFGLRQTLDTVGAFLGPLAKVPGSTTFASSSWSAALTGDDGTSYTFAPNGVLDAGELLDPCSLNTSRSRLINGVSTYSCIGSFADESPTLTEGVLYQLSIRHTITTDADKLVPEPGTLALLGAGLVAGMFGATRRRREQA